MQLWVLLVIGLLCHVGLGAEIIVSSTLSEAIGSAADGDTIILPSDSTFTGLGNVNITLYGRSLSFNATDSATIDCASTNSSAFVITTNIDLNVTTSVSFNGITFINCMSAIFINNSVSDDNCSISVTNSAFKTNKNIKNGGGAIYVEGFAFLNIDSSLFDSNVGEDGGAVYAIDYAVVSITNSTFQNNNASYSGGALNIMFDASGWVEGSTFINNFGHEFGGAINFYSAAVSYVSGSVFTRNRGNERAGAISTTQGVVYITSSSFSNNTGFFGGALATYRHGVHLVRNSQLIQNRAINAGGAVCSMAAGTTTVYNSLITQNSAYYGGGAASITSAWVSLVETEVSFNQASGGGAIFVNDLSNVGTYFSNLTSNTASEEGDSLYCRQDSNVFINNTQMTPSSSKDGDSFGVFCDPIPEYTHCRLNVIDSGDWTGVCPQPDPPQKKDGLKGWEIALIVVGTVVGALLIGFLVAYAISSRFEAPSNAEKLRSDTV